MASDLIKEQGELLSNLLLQGFVSFFSDRAGSVIEPPRCTYVGHLRERQDAAIIAAALRASTVQSQPINMVRYSTYIGSYCGV